MNDSALACRYSIERAGGLEHTDLDDLNRLLRVNCTTATATGSRWTS